MENVISQLHIVTVPAGTELYLWDIKNAKMSDSHFVTMGDMDVVVRKGHGPVTSLLEKYIKNGDIISEVKNYFMDLYKGRQSPLTDIISHLREEINDVDALLMATSEGKNPKAAVLFLHDGNMPNLDMLM
jgi:hypothetical protein